MANFVICLEIRETSRDYSRLRQMLTKMAAAQVQNSVWFASINGRAEQLRDALRTVVHSGDSIIVVRLQDNGSRDWAEFHDPKEGLSWLQTHYR
jgi:CRISPR-associated endonuclease Cas2